jgi:hypothetical protein
MVVALGVLYFIQHEVLNSIFSSQIYIHVHSTLKRFCKLVFKLMVGGKNPF